MANSREVSLGSAFAFVKCQPRQSRCWKTQRNWSIIGSNLPIITRSLSAFLRNYCFAGVFMWSGWELRHNYCVGLQRRNLSVTKVNMRYYNFLKIPKMCNSWDVLLESANRDLSSRFCCFSTIYPSWELKIQIFKFTPRFKFSWQMLGATLLNFIWSKNWTIKIQQVSHLH